MKEEILSFLAQEEAALTAMAKAIWDRPELAFDEHFASALQKEALAARGFRISDIPGMDTAFIAEAGEGGPTIGFLGEYDGLAGLSQAVSGKKAPLQDGGPGHGCGHNLLGVGSLGAALACAHLLHKKGLPGKVRFYGSPAEEALIGKVLMADKGVFDDLDAAFTWHPSGGNQAQAQGSLALTGFRIRFKGRSAHAGAGPYLGRSALDAVELMNVGANYMREHILPTSRIHYIITRGGAQVNSVPDEAEVLYNLRAESAQVLLENTAWLLEIARGAAMMTQTAIDHIEVVSGVHDTRHNPVLTDLIEASFQEMGGPVFSDEAHALAQDLQGTLSQTEILQGLDATFLPHDLAGVALHEGWLPHGSYRDQQSGSTDVGDVSKRVPLGQALLATWPPGVIPHTWQATASSGSAIGMAGMLAAAKVLARAAMSLYTDADLLAQAQAAFQAVNPQGPPPSVLSQVQDLI